MAARDTSDALEDLRVILRDQQAAGRVVEAMQALTDYLAAGGAGDFAADIHALKLRAFAKYNAHRERGEIEQAEPYVAGLAALLPDHMAIAEAAFDCNRLLGRLAHAADYAIALLNLDTAHQRALTFIADMRKSADTAEIEIARRMMLAMAATRVGKGELYRLRDLHGAASAILSGTLDDHNIARLRHILDRSAAINVSFAPGSRGELWEMYFRLKLESIDLAALLMEVPADGAEEPLAFSTTQGETLDWRGVHATAERLGARAVFFAAADERYVARYAKWYAATILMRCDVPCLVVIHVIGGADNLAAIAAGVGLSDPRLIFAGDSFDAAAVTSRVIDSPNDAQPTVPVTHFQSARFLRLEALLKHLNLPVFVSDIDMLLQRGVADLLDAHAQTDAVFNENAYALSLADRLTANLLLVYPTARALLFARFLRAYLERHLRKREIIRWIDQIGLLLGRHYLRRLEGASTGTFDTALDINNVMLPAYIPNPYRFLSLYQGFDMASLNVLIRPPA